MQPYITDTPELRAPCGRPRVDLGNAAAVAQWLGEARAALCLLTGAARDACARERVYSRPELRRRVRKADRLVRALLAEAEPPTELTAPFAEGDRPASPPAPPLT